MRQSVVMAALAVGVSVMSVAAQGRNFSGTWVIDAEKTIANAPSGGAGGGIAMGGGGGGGAMVARGGGSGGAVGGGTGGAVMGGGGGGGTMVARPALAGSTGTVITLDATTFTIEVAGVSTSYPTNGTEATIDVRGVSGRATAKWHGDVLTITTTIDGANGPVTSSQSWSMEGESLVRETTRKTYYKRK
jgi:hypothetical protein